MVECGKVEEELGPFARLSLHREKSRKQKKTAEDVEDDKELKEVEEMEQMFLGLSMSRATEVSLLSLEKVVSVMKEQKAETILLTDLMKKLLPSLSNERMGRNNRSSSNKDCFSKKEYEDGSTGSGQTSKENSPVEEVRQEDEKKKNFEDGDEIYPPEVEKEDKDIDDEESISSSVNSSWIESPEKQRFSFSFGSSPINNQSQSSAPAKEQSSPSPFKFSFKTPKKIFNDITIEKGKAECPPDDKESCAASSGFNVDTSPPPNFFDRSNVNSNQSSSVFGPPDESFEPDNKKTDNKNPDPKIPVARTLFRADDSKPVSEASTRSFPSSSLFTGDYTSCGVTFEMGKCTEKGTRGKNKKLPKKGGIAKSQMNKNKPTTNFQAFVPPPAPTFESNNYEAAGDDEASSPNKMDTKMDTSMDDSVGDTNPPASSFSFSMGSSSSKPKSTKKKNRKGSGLSSKANLDKASQSADNSNFRTSPIKNQQNQYSESPDSPNQDDDNIETDARMMSLAELFKKEGKQLYTMQRYEMAYDAFSKALKAAPKGWPDCANVLSNRAASLMMLERITEAIADCEEASLIDPSFLKVHSRRGRALFKMGRIDEATSAFQYVLSAPVSEEEAYQNQQQSGSDFAGRNLSRAAMKQIVLAKSLLDSLNRMQHKSESLDDEGSTGKRAYIQTSEELLALCPYMREAQVHKARAISRLHNWEELKMYIESVIITLHPSMQEAEAHPLARFPLPESIAEDLRWEEKSGDLGSVEVDQDAVKNVFLAMGSSLAKWYLLALKNQPLSRTPCASDVMRSLTTILSDLRVQIERANRVDSLLSDDDESPLAGNWAWLLSEVTKISNTLSLKTSADEKFRMGQYSEAIRSYTTVLQVDPEAHVWNAVMFGNRAAASMRLHLYSDAVSDCHQSLARDPQYARAYLRRARAQRQLNHFAASIRDYKKYLKVSPPAADHLEVQHELEEVTNAKLEEELLSAARKKREAEQARDRERQQYQQQYRSDSHDSRRSRGRENPAWDKTSRNSRKAPEKEKKRNDFFEERQRRENRSNQQQYSRQQSKPGQSPSEPKNLTPQVDSENFYARLGVSVTADEKVIKVAYRKMALKYHPDKNKEESSTEIFKRLTEAYSTLSDPSLRREYDSKNRTTRMAYGGSRRSYASYGF